MNWGAVVSIAIGFTVNQEKVFFIEKGVWYGTDADPIFSGSGEYEAYDKQCKEPAHYAACADPGDPAAGE